jgi:arylsulfatase A-like enzyme
MSVYPTLCELASIEKPGHVEGLSIKPLLANPAAEWKHVALTTHGYKNHGVRSDRWRYIRYEDGGEELYDHTKDEFEWTNLANEPALEKVKAEMQKALPKTDHADAKGGGETAQKETKKERNQRRKAAAGDNKE